jgi:hypothetical protein
MVGSSPDQVKPKTIKLVFVASPQARSIKEKEQRLVGDESLLDVSSSSSGSSANTTFPKTYIHLK